MWYLNILLVTFLVVMAVISYLSSRLKVEISNNEEIYEKTNRVTSARLKSTKVEVEVVPNTIF